MNRCLATLSPVMERRVAGRAEHREVFGKFGPNPFVGAMVNVERVLGIAELAYAVAAEHREGVSVVVNGCVFRYFGANGAFPYGVINDCHSVLLSWCLAPPKLAGALDE